MTENQTDKAVSKSRKGSTLAIVGVVVVVVALVAVAYATGIGPFASDTDATATTPATSTTPDTSEPAASTPAEDTGSTTTGAALPSDEALEQMYWEQIASALTIEELVENEFASFEFTAVTVGDGEATVAVNAAYRSGAELNGTLVLLKSDSAWYLKSITRDGNSVVTPDNGTADIAIAKTIAEQQAANQDVPAGILDGSITGMTINEVTQGSGTITIAVSFTGTGAAVDGSVTCISDSDGNWFITELARS